MAFYSPIYLFLLHDRQLERAKSNIDTGNGHMLKITVIHGQNHKGSGPFYFFHSHILYESFCPYEIFHWFNIYILDADQPKAYMFHKKAVVISTAAGMGTKKAIKDISTCLFYWGIQKLWDQCSSKRLAVREWKEKIKMAFIWWVEYKKWGLALVLLKNNTEKNGWLKNNRLWKRK